MPDWGIDRTVTEPYVLIEPEPQELRQIDAIRRSRKCGHPEKLNGLAEHWPTGFGWMPIFIGMTEMVS